MRVVVVASRLTYTSVVTYWDKACREVTVHTTTCRCCSAFHKESHLTTKGVVLIQVAAVSSRASFSICSIMLDDWRLQGC